MTTQRQPSVAESFDLSQHTVLITAGTGGLGRALVSRFAEARARVVFTFLNRPASARALIKRLRAQGADVHALACDITKTADVKQALTEFKRDFGKLDTLVNNAGLYPVTALTEISDAEWHQVMDTNLTAAHLLTQGATGLLRRSRSASVINIASIEARDVATGHAHYAASKAGLVMYSRVSAMELGSMGIRVNSVSPGLLDRRGLAKTWPDGYRRYRKAAALSRVGHANEVADVCLFLASKAARWVTGTDIVVDGGVTVSGSY